MSWISFVKIKTIVMKKAILSVIIITFGLMANAQIGSTLL
jgi:hypothetical protein